MIRSDFPWNGVDSRRVGDFFDQVRAQLIDWGWPMYKVKGLNRRQLRRIAYLLDHATSGELSGRRKYA